MEREEESVERGGGRVKKEIEEVWLCTVLYLLYICK